MYRSMMGFVDARFMSSDDVNLFNKLIEEFRSESVSRLNSLRKNGNVLISTALMAYVVEVNEYRNVRYGCHTRVYSASKNTIIHGGQNDLK